MYATDPPIHTSNPSAAAARAGERTDQPIRQLSHQPSNPCTACPAGKPGSSTPRAA